ncbi:hypothetical protein [Ichthyobacterium seriolicida]|uniref:Uncharacterized protein n=1 Tax=Ichthyobacterium seriolicida TaxID=242600 RepID=A0A1J1E8H7_9FLAO|nr:hypothetical protein [Ichthyobacterium seriolicida]BAV94235.1 hypothetical protein JBKA6_0222 [Ichthyobacterium seriolicida]
MNQVPKFLLADNSNYPDSIYVVHTEYPRFIYDISNDEIILDDDDIEDEDKENITQELSSLIEEAQAFYDSEMSEYDK